MEDLTKRPKAWEEISSRPEDQSGYKWSYSEAIEKQEELNRAAHDVAEAARLKEKAAEVVKRGWNVHRVVGGRYLETADEAYLEYDVALKAYYLLRYSEEY
jgi:hypothetical protein